MARTTIKDIARECGVSLSTVSLVLNNNPRISEATRQKVLESVQKHEYQPNTFARSLASQSSRSLSVVVPHLNNVFADTYFGEIVSGIYEHATKLGYKVLLEMANQKFVSSKEYINLLKTRRVDGLLILGSSVHDDYLHELAATEYPYILVNHYFPGRIMNFISADYIESARIAANHLLQNGHREIGLLIGTTTNTALDFRDHFLRAYTSSGIPDTSIHWSDGWFTEQGGYEGAQWLYERHPNLTAIMAGNDKMAIGAMRYFTRKGIKVPEDITVIGMDDVQAAEFANPALTTIRHNLYDIGCKSVEGLLTLFRKEAQLVQQTLPVKLIERESSGPARKA
ncbi:MAG TPA: LacI family DNA-binding transcriptional regulator [Kiritimatiellia bacterium]|nr:LacI family DNA-binding transcriptional regulator [Kiritimatiellia bacterium]